MSKPFLVIAGRTIGALDFLNDFVKNIFGEAIQSIVLDIGQCNARALSENFCASNSSLAVVTSHSGYYTDTKILFPHNNVINGEKLLTGFNLEKLLVLEPGTKVLVINYPMLSILESIENLLALGIDHLEYIPFLPGGNCSDDVNVAVSPGLINFCPAKVQNRIDIGYRIFSFDTLSKIIKQFGLDSHYIDKAASFFHKSIIISSNKLSDNIEKTDLLSREKLFILNSVPDGILAVNNDKTITSANKAMEAIAGLNNSSLIGKTADEIIGPISRGQRLAYDMEENIQKKIILNNTEYTYSLAVMQRRKGKNYIFTFKNDKSNIAGSVLNNKYKYYFKGFAAKYNFNDFWGDAPQIIELKKKAALFAKSDMNVFITGESGTGKEIIAQSIHNSSMRKNFNFLPVNFAAIANDLVESELFGYESGAFTGARKEGKPGYFEMASGGTLFLDEIGSMPVSLQTRLLRVLQEREVMRIGDNKTIPVNVRIIAATNADIAKKLAAGDFRHDLFFRLNVLSLETIALRDFKGSIPQMIKKYFSIKYSCDIKICDEVTDILINYGWAGNVRELFNVCDYMYYVSEGNAEINVCHIPQYIKKGIGLKQAALAPGMDKGALSGKAGNPLLVFKKQELFRAVLKIYASDSKKCGRRFIVERLREQGMDISEHYLKTILAMMKKDGLILVGSKRQGTAISEKGRRFINIGAKK